MLYMLDTNICIYIINNKSEMVIDRLKAKMDHRITLSSITLSELEYGVQKSNRREKNALNLLCFLAPFEIIPYKQNAARKYGIIRAELEKRGTIIGGMDMLIAAHALALDAILVTNNEKEFQRVPGLKLENWAK